jgi:hypothetical protein
VKPAPPADEAAWLRRVTLDLAGRIPTAAQTRRFLGEAAPDKRARLIDELLAAPTYAGRMTDLFHVMLMERRGDHPEWRTFLRAAFEANRPWDQMAREMLAPSDTDEQTRGAAFFYTKRLESYGQNPIDRPGLTRDVGRLLLGVDLQCAQCHDHLFIDDYKQVDFQGLFAVYQDVAIRGGGKFPAVTEKPPKQRLDFVSVFDPTQRQVGPRVPFGAEFPIPEATDGSPAFSPLALLAENLPRSDLFARNIVNRLWFVMMGRGLVHPLDLHHSGNAPSHPELLDLLAREFAAHQYDIRWLLRELALTETYQRSSLVPNGQPPPPADRFLVALERRLSAEQLLTITLQATGNEARYPTDGDAYKLLRTEFEKSFGNEPREPETEFRATVAGALFLLNSDHVLDLLKRQPGNSIDRLVSMDDPNKLADELFLTVFTRRPTDEERARVAEHLAKNNERREAAIGQQAWAMLSSMEFYVNH